MGRARRAITRTVRFLLDHALGAAVGFAVAVGGAAVVARLNHGPAPVPEQLGAILRDADKHGLSAVYNREIDLRGTGSKAHLLIFRPRLQASISRSDELRVYDEVGKRLKLGLAVSPVPEHGQVADRLDLVAVGAYDQSDRQEAILSLQPNYADARPPYPVALIWNAASQVYVLRSLLPRPIDLPRARGAWAIAVRDSYRATDIRLSNGAVVRRVRSTNGFQVKRSALVAAFVVRQDCNACVGVWEFKAFNLDFQDPEIAGIECAYFEHERPVRGIRLRVKTTVDLIQAEHRALRAASC